ncbi:unnamed protein product, partial [Effrenium voratum]
VHLFTIPHGRISPSRPGWKDTRFLGVPRGPAELLAEKIQLLNEPEVENPRFSATDLLDFEDRF